MKRMLINATQEEEIRVAMVDGQMLYDFNIERPGSGPKKGDIYKGRITSFQPSLDAVFVEYANDRQGFLPVKTVAPEYYSDDPNSYLEPAQIIEKLKIGQEILVQIVKEERGDETRRYDENKKSEEFTTKKRKKQAALTTYISLASSYLVLMPNKIGAGGISRRVEGDIRTEARELRSGLELPEEMGLIIRTAGVDKSQEELQWDLNLLLKQWEAIKTAYQAQHAPFLVYQESDIITRTIRDYLRKDIGEIYIDDEITYTQIHEYVKAIAPDYLSRIKPYKDSVPLFTRFQIESQIESAFKREVHLPSGGMLVIDQAEALTAIDVNSAGTRRSKTSNSREANFQRIEETAFNTNLEAAREIARQLRLRDLGGIIVIDFIDMSERQNQREIERCLSDALKADRARIKIGRISQFGTLEMQRQRLRPSLDDVHQISCPRCQGKGSIRSVESLASSIMRLIEENALKDKTLAVNVQVPVAVATFLNNEKRQQVYALEHAHKVNILIIANPHLETPQYKIERLRSDEVTTNNEYKSYLLVSKPEEELLTKSSSYSSTVDQPAVKSINLMVVAANKQRRSGILSKLVSSLFGNKEPASTPEPTSVASSSPAPANHERRHSNNNRRGPRPQDPRRRNNQSRQVPNRQPVNRASEKQIPNQLPMSTEEKPSAQLVEPQNITVSVPVPAVVPNPNTQSSNIISPIEPIPSITAAEEIQSKVNEDKPNAAPVALADDSSAAAPANNEANRRHPRAHNNRRRHHLRGKPRTNRGERNPPAANTEENSQPVIVNVEKEEG